MAKQTVTPLHDRLTGTKRVPEDYREHPLAAASLELDTARAVVDFVYCAAADSSKATLGMIDQSTLCGVMHDVLERIDRAKGLVDSVPHVYAPSLAEVSHG